MKVKKTNKRKSTDWFSVIRLFLDIGMIALYCALFFIMISFGYSEAFAKLHGIKKTYVVAGFWTMLSYQTGSVVMLLCLVGFFLFLSFSFHCITPFLKHDIGIRVFLNDFADLYMIFYALAFAKVNFADYRVSAIFIGMAGVIYLYDLVKKTAAYIMGRG